MSRKFSIITKTIDFNKLDKELYEYMMLNGYEPYLFMRKDTLNAILNECPTVDDTLEHYQIRAKVNGVAGYYCGCKVFEDNTLKLGEVEIR